MSNTNLYDTDSPNIIYVGDEDIYRTLKIQSSIEIGFTQPDIGVLSTYSSNFDASQKVIFIVQTKIGLNKLKACLDLVHRTFDNVECWAIADHIEVSQSTILSGIGFDNIILTNVDSVEDLANDVIAAIDDFVKLS